MATRAYIIERERQIIIATEAVRDLIAAYKIEQQSQSPARPIAHPSNHDVYGTSRVNAYTLMGEIKAFMALTQDEFS